MKLPRLLPLIAIAMGGVVAVNALAGAGSLPEMFSSARAFAEDAVASVSPKGKKPDSRTEAAAETKVAEAAPGPVPVDRILDPEEKAKTAMVCAPGADQLAKEAGLSSGELAGLQNLAARRGQIEALEKNVDVQQQLMASAEAKVDAKLRALQASIGEMKALLGQADEKKKAETARLVTIYEGMKPDAAAQAMTVMKDDVRLDIASAMKPRSLSAILNKMTPAAAKDLTEKLAMRYAASPAAQVATQAAAGQAAAPPAKAPAPKAPEPAKVVSAAPPKAPAPRPKAPAPKAKAPEPKQGDYPRVGDQPAAPAATPPAAAQPEAKTG